MSKSTIEIKPINIQSITIPIIGISELVIHAWDEKTKQQMIDSQSGGAKRKNPPRRPEEEYKACFYYDADGNSTFPARGFKAAIVRACKMVDGLAMVDARSALFVSGEFVRIYGTPRMRKDMVRLDGGGAASPRFRPGYPQWYTRLSIEFNADFISAEQIVNLLNIAGFGVGVGEGRPEKSTLGWGRWRIMSSEEAEKLEW